MDLCASLIADCSIVYSPLPIEMKCVVEPGGWIAVHVCGTQESSFYVEKAHRPLFQQALQKSKQSGLGIVGVLLRPRVPHKGPPLLPPFFTSFNPNLNETQTKRSCQWSARRGGLSREMKTCRRLRPNRLPVSKRRMAKSHTSFMTAF